MPPRKRKAPPRGLQPIAESPQQAKALPDEPRDPHGRTKEEALQRIEDEVTERIQSLLATGRELAAAVRLQAQVECARIPKKTRETSVADFFNLTEEEAQSSTLTGLNTRLALLAPNLPGPTGHPTTTTSRPAAAPAPLIAPPTAAPTTRNTRRTAARTAQQPSMMPPPSQPQQNAAEQQSLPAGNQQGGEEAPHSPVPASHSRGAQNVPAGVLRDSTNDTKGLMLPPAARKPGGASKGQEQQQATNAGDEENDAEEQQAGASTPPKQQQEAVAATPMATYAGFGGMHAGLLASASQMMSTTMRALPGGASLMAGFTLMKRTVARGRTRRPAEDENAIMISTADGNQYMVDAGTGLANVPEKYKKEVSAQLEVLQRLAAAALRTKG